MKLRTGMGCFAIFISVFYVVGFGALGYGLLSARRSTQAANWPTTPGNLKAVELKENSSEDGLSYQVTVQYTYTVAGTKYDGSRLAFGYYGSNVRNPHEGIYHKLKAAKSLNVRYDPENPESSVLSYGIHQSIQFMLAFAITWLAFVIGFTVIWWVATRSDNVLLQNLSVQ